MANWTNDNIIKLIKEVHVRPGLWDTESKYYKDRKTKKAAWAALGAQFNTSAEEAYKKWRNLRTYAQTEAKKKMSYDREVSWFAYDAMSFIITQEDVGSDSEQGNDSTIVIEKTEVDYNNMESEDEDGEATTLAPPASLPKSRKTVVRTQPNVTFEVPAKTDFRANPYSSFGEHVANKLNSYDGYTRSHVEFQISKILFDADMGMFNSSQV